MNSSVLDVDPALESAPTGVRQRTVEEILLHMTEHAEAKLLADGADAAKIEQLTPEEIRILRNMQREFLQARSCVDGAISLELFAAISSEARRLFGVTLPKPSMADYCY